MKKIIWPATVNASNMKRKMSGRVETENVITYGHQDSSEKKIPADFLTNTMPQITVPTDATAVPESQFVPDFDADPPIRPGGEDEPNESTLEASTLPEASDEKPPPF